jgi:hypothetical protein
MGQWRYNFTFLNFGTRCKNEWLDLSSGHFTPVDRTPGTHCTRGIVDPVRYGKEKSPLALAGTRIRTTSTSSQ